MRTLFLALAGSLLMTAASAQSFWHYVGEQDLKVPEQATRTFRPTRLKALTFDYAAVQKTLAGAPMEFTAGAKPVEFDLPTADGGARHFRVWESPVMAPELGSRYPDIRTYVGQAADGFEVRLGTGPDGFYAFMFAPDGAIQTIRPYADGQQSAYMVYHLNDLPRADFLPDGRFQCGSEDGYSPVSAPPLHGKVVDRGSGSPVNVHKYRAAISAQGEYSVYHGGNKTLVMNAIVTALNFIRPIQERDLDVRLELIPGNDTLIYLDPNTDPYSGAGVGDWFQQNPAATAARVSPDSFDIGHVFCRIINPPGGVYTAGIASLAGVCKTGTKAKAGSSLPAPIGEEYYLIIAHEMGHQFSATHTFNSCPPAADSREPSTAYEPGGGSTIMSYAGTCDPDIVENTQQPYYHIGSIEQIRNYITQDAGSTCGELITNTGNTAPDVSLPGLTNGFSIPISTPFALTGQATDMEADNLTYSWEQFNTGPLTGLGAPVGDAPAFRSFLPVSSPTRIFPRIQTIISNMPSETEVLPTYNRELLFRFTARDNHPGAGGLTWTELKFKSTTLAGPFTVSAPNNALAQWFSGDFSEVTWNVANTDRPPVNCKTVNIRLSTDGGLTYPTLLASGVPNIGRYCVTVPNITSVKARVKVEAADNIFFDISNADFKIVAPPQPGFSLCTSHLLDSVCLPEVYSIPVSTSQLLGFSEPVALSFSSSLTNVNATFTPNPVTPGSDAVLTLDFPTGHPEGTFSMTILGSAAGQNDSSVVSLYLVNNDFSPLALLTPADGVSGQDEAPLLSWQTAADANVYEVQMAANPTFSPDVIVATQDNIGGNSYKIPQLLGKGKVLYWRVRPKNECMTGDWVGPFVFATLVNVCQTFESTDVPKNISASGAVTVESKITVPAGGVISDVNVTKIQGNHEYFKDLEVHLISPANTDVLMFKDKCPNYNGLFNFGFDDSKTIIFGCPPPKDGTSSKPAELLSAFNGQGAGGTWILRVKDNQISSGGKITGFAIELCSNASLNPPVLVNNNVMSIDPGKNKAVTIDLLKATDANNTDDQLVYTLVSAPQHGELQLNGSGIKMVAGAQFSQTDLNNGGLRYFDYATHSIVDKFCFTVTDGEGGLIKDCFTIQPTVGATEPGRSLDFTLAPNPATETVRIAFGEPLASDTRIRLFDAAGRLLHEQNLARGQVMAVLNVADLPEGIYTVTVGNSAGMGVRKVVVR